MRKIVNLRQARKQRGRAAEKAAGDANAARFGRTRADRERAEKAAALEHSRHEAHKRDET